MRVNEISKRTGCGEDGIATEECMDGVGAVETTALDIGTDETIVGRDGTDTSMLRLGEEGVKLGDITGPASGIDTTSERFQLFDGQKRSGGLTCGSCREDDRLINYGAVEFGGTSGLLGELLAKGGGQLVVELILFFGGEEAAGDAVGSGEARDGRCREGKGKQQPALVIAREKCSEGSR